MKTTKISKILLIIAIILAIVTIGMFFYKNSCYQEYRRYGNNHSSDDMKLKNRQITQNEYENFQEKQSDLHQKERTAATISYISAGGAIVALVGGISMKIIEKKKNNNQL